MSSRSRKILDLIQTENSKSPHQNLDNQADTSSNELIKPNYTIKSQSIEVQILCDIKNKPENQQYMDVSEYFEATKGRKKTPIDYRVSPVNPDESDADLSDGDPSFQIQNEKRESYKQQNFSEVYVRNRRTKMLPLNQLTLVKAYTGKQELSENKKKDLRELITKNLIPHFYSDFYDSIL
ncbi:uncharacterized protein LOC101737016 isoform X2 [Bombyx mori]|uniref:Uncharacterized protein n=1 Tax=Bombyx mori TaxID=7091 RepID=A0A8R2DK66_BOMMO|nr:uncharacterized protein LOC101737016 isoform X2 [Bombyx mori]